jgi:hypothetical protein
MLFPFMIFQKIKLTQTEVIQNIAKPLATN